MDLAERASRFMEADSSERRSIADAIAQRSQGALEVVRTDSIAVFLHRPSSVILHLVPGGTAQIGFAESERDRLRDEYQYWDESDEVEFLFEQIEIGCVRTVRVASFLLAAHPLSGDQLDALLRGEVPPSEGRSLPDLVAMKTMSATDYVSFIESFGRGMFERERIDEVERALHRVGLRFPSDAEREHAARAGTQRLFAHGDAIPKTPNTGESLLGFVDLGGDAEVCADGWVPTIDGIPADGRPRPPAVERVVRGGAAAVYPWQGCGEWAMMLCASRQSSKGWESCLVARPAMSLP